MGMGGPGYSTAGPLGGGRLMNLGAGDMGARPWGQKISSHDKLNEWKLFVGQVPLEVGAQSEWDGPSFLRVQNDSPVWMQQHLTKAG